MTEKLEMGWYDRTSFKSGSVFLSIRVMEACLYYRTWKMTVSYRTIKTFDKKGATSATIRFSQLVGNGQQQMSCLGVDECI
jgi:hypothetical protein